MTEGVEADPGKICGLRSGLEHAPEDVVWHERRSVGRPQAPAGARRPVLGVVANLESPALPDTQASWELATPPYMKPGNDLVRAWTERHVLFWHWRYSGSTGPATQQYTRRITL